MCFQVSMLNIYDTYDAILKGQSHYATNRLFFVCKDRQKNLVKVIWSSPCSSCTSANVFYNIYLQHAAARVADERVNKLLVPKHTYSSYLAQFV